jgi:signal transduction histidine kinase
MISCGEPSGDLYAGALATEIKRLEPTAIVSGFGLIGMRERASLLHGRLTLSSAPGNVVSFVAC